jgi:hypothetical protein
VATRTYRKESNKEGLHQQRGGFVKRLIAVLLAGATSFALMGTPAAQAGSALTYDSKNFYCTASRTHAAVKMWEHGLSGVNQFQVTFVAQYYQNGRWHNGNSKEVHSNIFRNDYQNHIFGWVDFAFTWNTTQFHREAAKMVWWHRSPDNVVGRKTLYTRSCH